MAGPRTGDGGPHGPLALNLCSCTVLAQALSECDSGARLLARARNPYAETGVVAKTGERFPKQRPNVVMDSGLSLRSPRNDGGDGIALLRLGADRIILQAIVVIGL